MSKYLRTALLLLVAACMLSSLDLSAKVKPQWVLNGEEQMNRKRISDNYVFKVFHTFSPDLGQLKDERFEPLMDYVRETYGAERLSMRLDSVTVAGSPVTYRVSFRDSSGDASVYARLADSYTSFEDFVDNEYGYEFYQLYAVTGRNGLPEFDDFRKVESNNLKATAMSLIPGMGQLYKGDKLKGYSILGVELASVACGVLCQNRMLYCKDQADKGMSATDSWRSKQRGWREFRNIAIGTFGVTYLFNLFDAAADDGMSRVLVSKPEGQQLTVSPSSVGAGVALTYRF